MRLACPLLLVLAAVAAPGFAAGRDAPLGRRAPREQPPPQQQRQQPPAQPHQQQSQPQQQQPQQQVGVEVWPGDWFSDLPAVEMTGIWVFDPGKSDPMISEWEGKEIRYEINQQGAFIVLEFRVSGSPSNTQTYRWDNYIEHFQRGGSEVEEAARWTDAGRVLEVIGRHWDPETPDERSEYHMRYRVDGDVLVFEQESETGRTVWRFDRRDRRPARRQRAANHSAGELTAAGS